MPYIDKIKQAPTAGTGYSLKVQRPLGTPMVLTRVTVTTYQSSKFAHYHGRFNDPTSRGNTRNKHIALINKIVPEETGATLGYAALLFEGRVPWPIGLELHIEWRCQTAVDTVTFNIMFEKIDPKDPAFAGWGRG